MGDLVVLINERNETSPQAAESRTEMKDIFKDKCRGDDRKYKKSRRSARRRIKHADRKANRFYIKN